VGCWAAEPERKRAREEREPKERGKQQARVYKIILFY
jgi:hypothetical protein